MMSWVREKRARLLTKFSLPLEIDDVVDCVAVVEWREIREVRDEEILPGLTGSAGLLGGGEAPNPFLPYFLHQIERLHISMQIIYGRLQITVAKYGVDITRFMPRIFI